VNIDALRAAVRSAFGELEDASLTLERLADRDASTAEHARAQRAFDEILARHTKAVNALERAEALAEARAGLPVEIAEPGSPDPERRWAQPKRTWNPETQHVGGEPSVYQSGNRFSFVKDQLAAQKGDSSAIERIVRAGRELASIGKPMRDRDGNVMEERAIAETAVQVASW
jgi:hypothetical protein